MTAAAQSSGTPTTGTKGRGEWLLHAPLVVPWLIALVLIAIRAWLTTGQGLANDLGDMDDAARLVQVREFLAGSPWFDTSTKVMGGEDGMLSHWSRFIDLPIALLLWLAKLVSGTATAELITRCLWPLMALAPLLWIMARTAAHVSGTTAAYITLALAVLSPLGLYQFDLGRIDHHNVMIAATVAAPLLMWAYPACVRAWRIAGILTGFALAIGYEALAPAAAIAIGAAVWGLLRPEAAAPARHFTIALAGTVFLAFVLTIPPARWFDVRCDALSVNMLTLTACGGGALAIVLGPGRDWLLPSRLALLGALGFAGLVVYGLLEPKCLAGPTGQFPPELKSIWIETVGEYRSIVADLLKGNITQSLGLIAYYGLGLCAAAKLARETRTPANLFLLAIAVAYVLFACWQYKYLAYATFIVAIPIAIWIAGLPAFGDIGAPALRIAATILTSQAVALAASGYIAKTIKNSAAPAANTMERAEACLKSDAIRELNALPAGLIAARIDMGSYIVALTPHHVLSAPYHRIADSIIANHQIFAARTADEAARVIAKTKIDYIVTCRGLDDPYVAAAEWQGTLRAGLVAGQAPSFLVPVSLADPNSMFKVWRVDPAKFPAG